MRIWNGYQRGINFGGWLSQGEKSDRYYDNFITESDFATVAKWGLDHVRIPIDYDLLESEGGILKESGFDRIKQCMEWCVKYHIRMILAIYKTPGYDPENPIKSHEFFTNPALQARFFSLWKQLSARFGSYTEVISFELLSDVILASDPEKWNEIASNAVSAIRSSSPHVSILVGSIRKNNAEQIPNLLPPSDRNIVYAFHCYDPIIFTHQTADWMKGMPGDFHISYPDTLDHYCRSSAAFSKEYTTSLLRQGVTDVEASMFEARLSQALRMSEQYDVPLYCSSYGVINQADLDSTLRWYQTIHQIFEAHGIGRSAWNYKGLDFGLIDSHTLPIADKLIAVL